MNFASSADALFFLGRREASHFDLDCAEALSHPSLDLFAEMFRSLAFEVVAAAGVSRNFVERPTAQISIQRQLGSMRIQVPHRDIENTESAHHCADTPVKYDVAIHLVPETLHAIAVSSKQHRSQKVLDGKLRNVGTGSTDIAESDSFNSLLGTDLDQAVIAGLHCARGK